MTIRIIDEPEIEMTQAKYERLRREWAATQQMTVAPQSFESWVRSRLMVDEQVLAVRHISGKGKAP